MFNIEKDKLHHAYLIEGSADTFVKLKIFVEEVLGESIIGNPDVHVREFGTLGIDEARELSARAHKKAIGTRKIFLCRAGSITREAQNALLKLLEEPPRNTHFFICTPNVTHILPTLHSRMWLVENLEGSKEESDIQADAFLKATPAERLEMITPLVKEKDVVGTQAFLEDIEEELYKNKKFEKTPGVFAHIYEVKSLLRDRGSSLKQLLESVALLVPKA